MNTFMTKLYIRALNAKNSIKKMLTDERGETNLIAIILILAIVVALALVFKDAIKDLFDSIWAGIIGDVDSAVGNY